MLLFLLFFLQLFLLFDQRVLDWSPLCSGDDRFERDLLVATVFLLSYEYFVLHS